MTKFLKSLALVALCLPLLASAGNKAATSSMQVSFVVKEACTVQTADNNVTANRASATNSPAVACQFKTPYQLTRGANQAATATSANSAAISSISSTSSTSNTAGSNARPEAGVQNWTITF
jgi:hypothetical protein